LSAATWAEGSLYVSGVNTENCIGKFSVFFGDDIPGIVGAQANLDTVPDVIPVGVVIHFFCKEGDFRHKGERMDEIPEGKGREEFVVGFGPHRSINILEVIKQAVRGFLADWPALDEQVQFTTF
jgi:hypothetical protein